MFNEQEETKPEEIEKGLKKLLTVTKSKFYMLRVNYPQVYDNIVYEVADSTVDDPSHEHDPFARTPGSHSD